MGDHGRLGEPRPDVRGADQNLRDVQAAQRAGDRPDGRLRRLALPRSPYERGDQDPGAERDEAMQEVRRGVLAELRDQASAHQRPVGEREAGVGASHVRADEQEREGHDARPR